MKFLRTLGVVLASSIRWGFILWLGVYLWRATPFLIIALGPGASWVASYWAVLFLGFAFLFLCLALFERLMKLNDQRHFYETKRRYREESLRQQALQRQYILVNAPACLICCCSRSSQNNAN